MPYAQLPATATPTAISAIMIVTMKEYSISTLPNYPPGTSKWNKIEHRLFCHITHNWRGRPLTDRVAVVELIGAPTTKVGLKVECVLDTRTYEPGIKFTDAEMEALNITGDAFHPCWNYKTTAVDEIEALIVRSVLTMWPII